MYERGLRWAGFDVAAFTDGSAFLAGLDIRMPDVVVLDWMMPGMKGGQLLELLRQDSRTEKLPVFILSSLPESGGAEAKIAVGAGAMGWLEKATTTPAALTQKVEEALGS